MRSSYDKTIGRAPGEDALSACTIIHNVIIEIIIWGGGEGCRRERVYWLELSKGEVTGQYGLSTLPSTDTYSNVGSCRAE